MLAMRQESRECAEKAPSRATLRQIEAAPPSSARVQASGGTLSRADGVNRLIPARIQALGGARSAVRMA